MLIPCLGGLHIAMNFLGVIGRHMSESGLSDLWIGCDLLGINATQHIMAGTGYLRATRTHKLTLQALWQLLLPQLYTYLDGIDVTLRAELSAVCTSIDADHITLMSTNWLPAVFGTPESVSCCSCSWKPGCWILVGLYDYGQHPTMLHTSTTWWIMGSPLICFQAYATIPLQVRPC